MGIVQVPFHADCLNQPGSRKPGQVSGIGVGCNDRATIWVWRSQSGPRTAKKIQCNLRLAPSKSLSRQRGVEISISKALRFGFNLLNQLIFLRRQNLNSTDEQVGAHCSEIRVVHRSH